MSKIVSLVVLASLLSVAFLVGELVAHQNYGCITRCSSGATAYWWCPSIALYSTCYCDISSGNYIFYSYFTYYGGGRYVVGTIDCGN